ncbi:unnamed protein product [Strongylus vulgaris]|uniref:Uncharacterized protein n=1 Tax=Strongylus vulgaris TaxID=40348 RepID=A0A3P7KYQ3_STRVU|nr:unnamed protein product [Strongylus vulgaris]
MEKNSAFDKGSLLSALMKPPVRDRFEALEKGEIAAEDFDPLFTQVFNKQDLRSAGCKTALLTNNCFADRAHIAPTVPEGIEKYFDVVVESCRAGMRKPEDAIYKHLEPEECMFLDDLGVNLKAARALGITTIKVASPPKAAEEVRKALQDVFKFPAHT